MLAKSSLVVCLVLASVPAWAAGCRVTPFSILYRIHSQSQMDDGSGQLCRRRMLDKQVRVAPTLAAWRPR